MSYSKLTSILLYVVAGISLVVMLFFYVSPKTVDNIDELESKKDALIAGGAMTLLSEETNAATTDSTIADSTAIADEMAMEADSAKSEVDSIAAASASTMDITPDKSGAAVEIDLRDHFTGWEIMVLKRTDYALYWAYILLLIAAIAALIFPMINIATDVKALIRLLAVIGVAVIMILLSYYVLASDTPIDIIGYIGTDNSNPTVLKWVGTGLFSTYFLFGLAILSILYSEVVKLFK